MAYYKHKQMLYERWQQVVQERREEIALRDLASGRCWTFAQLDAAAETPMPENSAMIHPQGNSPEFIIAVLRAWRERIVVCPLEAHHQPLEVSPPRLPCCHLKTTPASTGVPRAVAFTQEQLAADAENIVTSMGLRPDWPNLGVISPAYSYGFSSLVLPLLLHGIPLYLVPSPLPVALRCAAHAHWNLTVAAVPALWHAWHKAGAILSNVRLAISAGAPLPLSLERAVFEEHGVKIHNFYGSTECGGIAYDRSAEPRIDDALVGTSMEKVSLDVNTEGCLQVRSQAVAEGYWPEPHEHLQAGLYQTSDLAEIEDGAVFLRGRLNDVINVAGRKVAPEVIERALLEHPLVREALAVGLPSEEGDRVEFIAAVVATHEPVTELALRQFLLSRLPAWQMPRQWRFVTALYTNGRGKISRADWRQRLAQAPAN